MWRFLLIVVCVTCLSANAKRFASLPRSLKEISGWVFVNDSTLIAHNDSGNEPLLYVLNLDGTIRHTSRIKDVENIDFEDITFDGKQHVFVGDIGNNANKRQDLVVYKLKLDKILSESEVEAKAIAFSYPDQTSFPADKKEFYFDAEALTFHNDSLFIFTKNRTVPFNGSCKVYALPTKAGNYKATWKYDLLIGKRDWYRDAITSGQFYKNELILLTYNRILFYSINSNFPKFETQIALTPITQKEALAVRNKDLIYVADERQKIIGGGNMYHIKRTKTKK